MQNMLFNHGVYKVKNSFVYHKGFNILIYTDPGTNKHRFFLGSWELNKSHWIANREITKEETSSIFQTKALGSLEKVFVS